MTNRTVEGASQPFDQSRPLSFAVAPTDHPDAAGRRLIETLVAAVGAQWGWLARSTATTSFRIIIDGHGELATVSDLPAVLNSDPASHERSTSARGHVVVRSVAESSAQSRLAVSLIGDGVEVSTTSLAFLEAQLTAIRAQFELLDALDLVRASDATDTSDTSGNGAEVTAVVADDTSSRPGEVFYRHGLLSRSSAMSELFVTIDRIKDTDISVIFVGETGTGKELVAHALHESSRRAGRPFEVVGCGSLVSTLLESELFGHKKGAFSGAEQDHAGIFERASGGTLFLDEIADMSNDMQQKILRVLQESQVRPVGSSNVVPIDVRLIASTRFDPSRLVAEGKLRADLFYRLNGMTLAVPALRERSEDIPLLIDHFLTHLAEEHGGSRSLSSGAMRFLCQRSWPGNIQELKNLLARAYLSSSTSSISKATVAEALDQDSTPNYFSEEFYRDGDRIRLTVPACDGFNDLIAECEKLIIISYLREQRGNKSRVTKLLRIPRQTLYNKIQKYGIQESAYLPER